MCIEASWHTGLGSMRVGMGNPTHWCTPKKQRSTSHSRYWDHIAQEGTGRNNCYIWAIGGAIGKAAACPVDSYGTSSPFREDATTARAFSALEALSPRACSATAPLRYAPRPSPYPVEFALRLPRRYCN